MKTKSNEPTHIAYADETNHNVGRYRGIALLTLRVKDAEILSDNLRQILMKSNIDEFKWVDLRSARHRFAAIKMVEFLIQNALNNLARMDILIWDTEDKRHQVQGRDDIANLERMYYHLFKNVMHKRWPHESAWILHPDINSAMKWRELFNFLKLADIGKSMEKSSGWQGLIKSVNEFGIVQIEPKDSKDEPLIQLADLFAGLATYSRGKYDCFEKWKNNGTRQTKLFEETPEPPIIISKADMERCLILDNFNYNCKRKKMGVSLKTNKGLKSFDPAKPINFWWYVPQHETDKAPVRKADDQCA